MSFKGFDFEVVPENSSGWKVFCVNEDCSAVKNGLISVIKIGWLIRCECCGHVHNLSYFQKELKKVGLEDE